jgi:hypothetical protein
VKTCNESQEIVTVKLNTLPQKLDALRKKFFPRLKEADLTDIDARLHPAPVYIDKEIEEKEIRDALRLVINNKTLNLD